MTTHTNQEEPSPFVCDMSKIESAQRKQHMTTTLQVFQAVQEIRELSNGYTFRLPNDAALLLKAAEFIRWEKVCCPFFGFTVEIEPDGGPLWLGLTGREGIKPFIQAEVGQALNETVAKAARFR